MNFPAYVMTLKSLSWKGGSRCLANTVHAPLTSPVPETHWPDFQLPAPALLHLLAVSGHGAVPPAGGAGWMYPGFATPESSPPSD